MRARTWLCLLASLLLGCELDVVDKTQSLLLKPELLSIVLEPPEAAPGEAVRASYLLADSRGRLQPLAQLWVPADLSLVDPAGVGPSPEWLAGLEQRLPALGLRFEDLRAEELSFSARADVPAGETATLSLLVQLRPLCVGAEDDPAALLERLPENLACGAVKLGLRRLAISNRAARASNPRVARILGTDSSGRALPLALARSGDPDLAAARRQAALEALALEEKTTVRLRLETGDSPAGLGFQWISTGGDFGGTRLQDQPFSVPAFRAPEAQPNGSDPNLYPVWLILRNSGGGQSWAELYLRIQKP